MAHTDYFDPISQLSTAPLAKPTDLESLNLRALTPLQRALLVIDGTVTTFIEAYTLEPVEIEQLSHVVIALAEPDPWLEASVGEQVAFRSVLIQGRCTGTPYVYATSRVLVERLPNSARRRLETAGEGIGRVLSASAIETRREVLWFGREHAKDLPPSIRERSGGEFITRTYRIVNGGRPLALITERFPVGIEPLPSRY